MTLLTQGTPFFLDLGVPRRYDLRIPHRYTQHLTMSEVDAFKSPQEEATHSVNEWLTYHGVDTTSAQRTASGDWITFTIPVWQAEALLSTEYHIYEHPASGEQVVRTLRYSLPTDLHPHIDVVAPTTYFGTMRSMKATSFLLPNVDPLSVHDYINQASKAQASDNDAGTVPASCNSTITPTCLRKLYKTFDYVPARTNHNGGAVNKLGVAGYLNEFANKVDHQVRLLC